MGWDEAWKWLHLQWMEVMFVSDDQGKGEAHLI